MVAAMSRGRGQLAVVGVFWVFAAWVLTSCAYIPGQALLRGSPATEFAQLLTDSRRPGLRPQPLVPAGNRIRVTYFGTSGFLIERGADAILLAPFFSHQSYLRGLWKIGTKKKLVNWYLAPHSVGLGRVQAILVGHGHYDHLLDVPYIADQICPAATVYGNDTVCNILNRGQRTSGGRQIRCVSLANSVQRPPGQPPYPPPRPRPSASTTPWNSLIPGIPPCPPSDPQGWTYVNNCQIRFKAIQSGHAPNFDGQTAASGTTSGALKRLPKKTGGYQMGEPYAYMIDFMEPHRWYRGRRAVAFRIFFQDAAYSPEPYYTLPPPGSLRGRGIDLAIVCVAVFGNSPGDNYPERLVQVLEAKQYLLSHWENFFMEYTQDLQRLHVVPLTDPAAFVRRLGQARPGGVNWVMPIPGATLPY